MRNGLRLIASLQRHKTLFLSNFSRCSICFDAGRTKLVAGGAAQKNSPVHGSGKRASVTDVWKSDYCFNWFRLVNLFSVAV